VDELLRIEDLMGQGREEELVASLQQDPSLATRVFEHGTTLLILAAQYGLPYFVTELIARGADLDPVDELGRSPLFAALESRAQQHPHATAIVEGLLKAGANPNVFAYLGQTPLHYALNHGLVAETQALLNAGADPNLPRESHERETPLIIAASAGNTELLELLRKHGAKY
jgi:ankyrin repeat protein